jgi:hypothetical protein
MLAAERSRPRLPTRTRKEQHLEMRVHATGARGFAITFPFINPGLPASLCPEEVPQSVLQSSGSELHGRDILLML